MQSGMSMKKIFLFYFTASSIILATTSGIQLFLKLYFAMDMFAYKIATIYVAIFYSKEGLIPSDCL